MNNKVQTTLRPTLGLFSIMLTLRLQFLDK